MCVAAGNAYGAKGGWIRKLAALLINIADGKKIGRHEHSGYPA